MADTEAERPERQPVESTAEEERTRENENPDRESTVTEPLESRSPEQPTTSETTTEHTTGGATTGTKKTMDAPNSGGGEKTHFSKHNFALSLQDEVHSLSSSYSKESVDSMDFLTESKDRAQLTATSALSLSLIVVLKEILDQDPDARYRTVSLVLVVLCLVMQVTVGLLAIYMYQLKARISVFRKRAILKQNLITSNAFNMESKASDVKRSRNSEKLSHSEIQNPAFELGSETDGAAARLDKKNTLAALTGATPEARTSGSLDDLNMTLLQMLTNLYSEVLLDIQKIQIRLIKSEDTEVEELQEALSKKMDTLKLVGAQIQIAEMKQEIISKREMFVKVTVIQNTITYLLYITFVINAFLTGFGISGNSS